MKNKLLLISLSFLLGACSASSLPNESSTSPSEDSSSNEETSSSESSSNSENLSAFLSSLGKNVTTISNVTMDGETSAIKTVYDDANGIAIYVDGTFSSGISTTSQGIVEFIKEDSSYSISFLDSPVNDVNLIYTAFYYGPYDLATLGESVWNEDLTTTDEDTLTCIGGMIGIGSYLDYLDASSSSATLSLDGTPTIEGTLSLDVLFATIDVPFSISFEDIGTSSSTELNEFNLNPATLTQKTSFSEEALAFLGSNSIPFLGFGYGMIETYDAEYLELSIVDVTAESGIFEKYIAALDSSIWVIDEEYSDIENGTASYTDTSGSIYMDISFSSDEDNGGFGIYPNGYFSIVIADYSDFE